MDSLFLEVVVKCINTASYVVFRKEAIWTKFQLLITVNKKRAKYHIFSRCSFRFSEFSICNLLRKR